MDGKIQNPQAFAEIHFDPKTGWSLSLAGHGNLRRYWSHVHFENDPNWGKELWTLFVELETQPSPEQSVYRVKVFFMAPEAPHHFLQPGRKFKLCVGEMVKATGVIIGLADARHEAEV